MLLPPVFIVHVDIEKSRPLRKIETLRSLWQDSLVVDRILSQELKSICQLRALALHSVHAGVKETLAGAAQ